MRTTYRKLIFIGVLFVLSQLLSGHALAQKFTSGSVRNEILMKASSPFEDLTEFAISGDRRGIKRALREYDAQATRLENTLQPAVRNKFKSLVANIKQAERHANYNAIALKSPEAYRVLIEALDRSSIKIPAEVLLLDYVGFRYLAVLHSNPGDWPALQEAATYAQKNWDAIKSKVTDMGLRDAIDVTMKGLMQAGTKKNGEMALFAAQVDLAQVDLLEAYFDKSGK